MEIETTPFSTYVEKPWGHEIVFTPPTLERTGKLIFVKAGCKLSLQYHDQKEETAILTAGEAVIWLGTDQASVQAYPMELNTGYTIRIGTVHRYQAITDCTIFEVSSPERGTTFRLEDDYKRDDEIRK